MSAPLYRFELAQQPADFEHEIINLATTLAFMAHHGQFRKDGCTPQILHPLTVQRLLTQIRISNPNIHAAALLHDSLEDNTPERGQWLRKEILRSLGIEVLDMVEQMTDSVPPEIDKPKRKAMQLERLTQAPWSVKVIKLADVVASMQEGPAPAWSPDYAAQYVQQRSRLVATLSDASPELVDCFMTATHQPVWQDAISASVMA
jgi:(p)ppGpp synthase/HD superfamily hydrolase